MAKQKQQPKMYPPAKTPSMNIEKKRKRFRVINEFYLAEVRLNWAEVEVHVEMAA